MVGAFFYLYYFEINAVTWPYYNMSAHCEAEGLQNDVYIVYAGAGPAVIFKTVYARGYDERLNISCILYAKRSISNRLALSSQ